MNWIRDVFSELDSSGDGTVTLKEFESQLSLAQKSHGGWVNRMKTYHDILYLYSTVHNIYIHIYVAILE
jgi:Ca2+-binding EF-hand superfamily protein